MGFLKVEASAQTAICMKPSSFPNHIQLKTNNGSLSFRRLVTTTDSGLPNVDRGQEQRHLVIGIHCDHESYFTKGEKIKTNNNPKNSLLANFHDP